MNDNPEITPIFDATDVEAAIAVEGLTALGEGNLLGKAFTDKFGSVVGVRNADGGTEIILGDDDIEFIHGEAFDEDVDVFAGLLDIKNGKAPSRGFLDHTGLTPTEVASFAHVSNNGAVPPALQNLLDLAAKTGAKVIGVAPSQGGTINLGGMGGPSNPDLSIGLSAASTPDADNPNHEWRDGKKYARGTSIEVVDKTTRIKPATFIPSAWESSHNKRGPVNPVR